jgi:lipopolysaccharide transport system ATP-binding protein
MKNTIQFDNVSKKYKLGLTRTSLPSLISGWFKRSWRCNPELIISNNNFWALQNVSFELKKGESLALIGANGAGKTTILKLLSKITKPTTGSIKTNGQLSALIELGAGFHPDLTGRENIFLNGTILGLRHRQIEKRLDEIICFSELERFIDTPVKRYSSGMVVRLGFAVASCIEPEILLVDEVLAVGDTSFQQKCMKRIRSLLIDGASIIFVSHNMYLIQAVCSRAIYLDQGSIKSIGETKDIVDMYEKDVHRKHLKKLPGLYQGYGGDPDAVRITKVDVLSAETNDPGTFSSDQKAQIRIYYYANRPVGKVHVSVFIRRSDGLTCCMMRTKIDNFELEINSVQGVVILFLESLQLITGSYYVEVWFLNDTDSMGIITRAGRSDWFSVKGKGLSFADDSGVFEPNTSWLHQPFL